MNKEVSEFLENYRRLEAAAAVFLPRDSGGKSGSVISRLLRHPKIAPYREELDCCREVRNLLTHEVSVEGAPPIIPGAGMNPFLLKLIDLLENPVRVSQRMTPRARLYTVAPETRVLSAMREMEKRNLSRVPCLVQERVEGILSTETASRLLVEKYPVTEETTVGDVFPYLSLDAVSTAVYRFVSPDTLLDEAESLFSHAYGRNTKIRALLVTENGATHAPLLGILSPYDVMEKQ